MDGSAIALASSDEEALDLAGSSGLALVPRRENIQRRTPSS